MKGMSLFSDVSTQRHVVGWVSIIWFTAAIAVSPGLELQTVPRVAARCGENVTLTCNVSSSRLDNIKLFSWHKNKSLCQYDSQHDPKVKCEYIDEEPLPQSLTLTLLNVMPSDQGKYLCKLRSIYGVTSNTADVKVQDCLETSGHYRNESFAECWFNGVYPGGGTVRWSQGELNFPAFYQKEEMDHHGRYNILSKLDVQKGKLNQPYTCSLWMPSTSKALFSHDVHDVSHNSVSPGLELQTVPQVAARCGENVTLTCNVSSSRLDNIKLFSWHKNKSLCQYDSQHDPKVKCEYIDDEPLPQSLTLTLLNVMPSDQGKYLCKLRSIYGETSNTADVKVQDCLETSGHYRNESFAECWFNGVYPGGGTVRWSQGELNFTAPAFYQKEEMDHHGRYNILSKLDVQKGKLNQPYTCSLWMPSTSKVLFSHDVHDVRGRVVTKLKGSSESMATLQWICLIMEIIMVKCMT